MMSNEIWYVILKRFVPHALLLTMNVTVNSQARLKRPYEPTNARHCDG